jgi:hypothetical protein
MFQVLAQMEDIGALLFWLVFILLPLVFRGLAWLAAKLGGGEQSPERPRPTRPNRAEPDRLPEPEDEIWRRLFEQSQAEEEDEAPDEVPVLPTREPARPEPAVPAPALRVESGLEHRLAEEAALAPALQGAAVLPSRGHGPGDPLSRLPSEVGRIREGPLRAALVGLEGSVERPGEHHEAPPRIARETVRSAVLWSEILGAPVALRDPRGPGSLAAWW